MIREVKIAGSIGLAALAVAAGAAFLVITGGPETIAPEVQAVEPAAEPAAEAVTDIVPVPQPVPSTETKVAEVAAPAPAADPIVSTLPGGANSLTEQHGDWTVTCAMAEAGKRCAFSQALIASQSGQRVMSLEVSPTPDGTLQATVVAPFSLRIDAGVKLSVDDKPLAGPLPFLTCAEFGCIVPAAFDATAVALLQAGKSLKVSATAVSNNQPIELALSLTGFNAASTRTAELLK